ncbi:MAG: extracellular solute-binding protein [Mariniblastus sp.]|nr:extracellular solute-binding protein [Mariniblastus sp.]
MNGLRILTSWLALTCLVALTVAGWQSRITNRPSQTRQEVLFWHFWGGRDRAVVDDVVHRFNESQDQFHVRAIAMPGNNLQAKLFLSVTGGDPPDLVNQDDPVLADWAKRGVIQPIASVATRGQINRLDDWMFESARRLSKVGSDYYGVCNGLDIRALYYNKTLLDQHGLEPPGTLEQLDRIADRITPDAAAASGGHYAYLPDSRRLWAWGYVFGGRFYDPQTGQVEVDSGPIQEATRWMASYSQRYGADNVAAFRQGDQSLPGKTFPLLPTESDSLVGRYGLIMDGQWRTRDLLDFQNERRQLSLPSPEFGVCPLPPPPGGRSRAGWVNGNFFVVPTGAKCPEGAWEFIQFWIGLEHPEAAAQTCAAGGWIPVSQQVVETTEFQAYLVQNPLFGQFVNLAGSPNQFPVPSVPGAAMFKRTVESAAYQAMSYPDRPVGPILRQANQRIQQQLQRAGAE